MTQKIDPASFGLHRTTQLEKNGARHYTLVINRKSRIIMKDGRQILSKVEKIKSTISDAVVDVRTTAPVCSKTMTFLEDQGISVSKDSQTTG